MNIANNIIKHYLKNVMFITGTAYAGKSTMCEILAEKYDLFHCKENYAPSKVQCGIINQKYQPNLNYFNAKPSWNEYFYREPNEFSNWIEGNNEEVAGFEIVELIQNAQNKRVIAETNIPINILREIVDYNQIAIMLSPIGVAENYFFERNDEEKVFIKNQILNSPKPKQTMDNFKEGIRTNNLRRHNVFINSGCFIIERKSANADEYQELLGKLTTHFGL